MVNNHVENMKIIGRREMNMDENLKTMFYQQEWVRYKPYFNDAKELFRILFLTLWTRTADDKQK